MSPRRKPKRKRKSTGKRHNWLAFLRYAIQFLIILLCIGAAYISWLDVSIQKRFGTHKWNVPGRVYAAVEELYPGMQISAARIENSLQRVGYQKRNDLSGPGEYRSTDDGIRVNTRQFRYWDGVEQAQSVTIVVQGGAITAIRDTATGVPVQVLRIEPELIGRLVSEAGENRVLLGRDGVPPTLVKALLSVEDRGFFEHGGLDFRGMLRALWANITAGEITQGGSTLTQQLVKNLFLSSERTLPRKINEALMAVLLERRYSKDDILQAYVNEVYLGQNGATAVHGFGTAAEFYFGRPLAELRLDQIALLVGLVRGASYYNPRRHPDRALERRNLVLELMARQRVIEDQVAKSAGRLPLDVMPAPGWSRSRYPDYLEMVMQHLTGAYDTDALRSQGLRVFTSLNAGLQDQVQQAIARTLASLEKKRGLPGGVLQAAVMLVDYSNGEVVALAGGRSGAGGAFNRGLHARRPIGSLIKPLVYLAALSRPERLNLLSHVEDAPLTVRLGDHTDWRPENYDHQPHGTVTVLEALAKSYNLATVRTGLALGVPAVTALLKRAGFRRKVQDLPSVLLGAVEMSPAEVAQVYQTIANSGFLVQLSAIREVVADDGRGLERKSLRPVQALDPAVTFLVTSAMSYVTSEGTAKAFGRELDAGGSYPGKTGSTNDLRDSWFVVFGGRMLAVVWVGRDDNRPMGLSGAAGAMRLAVSITRGIPFPPYTMPAPPAIAWATNVKERFGGVCRTFGHVPYIAGYPVTPGDGC